MAVYVCSAIRALEQHVLRVKHKLELAWEMVDPRLAGQMATLPEFDGVCDLVVTVQFKSQITDSIIYRTHG